jgi:hypothetical protein
MAKTKKVKVEAFIPELAAGHAFQESRGDGSNLAVAVGRAVDQLLKLPHVKGRRLSSLKLTIAVLE